MVVRRGEFLSEGRHRFWLKRVHPFYFAKRGHDEVQDGNEEFLNTGIRFNFTRQGFLKSRHVAGSRTMGRPAIQDRKATSSFYGNVQILRWLNVNGGFGHRADIYYDPVNPFQGRVEQHGLRVHASAEPALQSERGRQRWCGSTASQPASASSTSTS